MTASDYMHQIVGDLIPSKENFPIVECANLVLQDMVAWDENSVSNNKKSIDSVIHKNNVKQVQVIAATDKKINIKYIFNDNIRILKPQVQVNCCVLNKIIVPYDFKVSVLVPRLSGQLKIVYTKIESLEIHKCKIKCIRNSNPQGLIFLIENAAQPVGLWQILVTITKTTFDTNFSNTVESTFFSVKAQRNQLLSHPSNDAVVNVEAQVPLTV